MSTDPYRLQRFVDAQNKAGTYRGAMRELHAGRKTSHWMWFIFPQLSGLGHSQMAREYAISSIGEARAYLDHPVLGSRLLECTQALLTLTGRTAHEIFGETDAGKLRSSMTLFARAASGEPAFQQVLDSFFAGQTDDATNQRL